MVQLSLVASLHCGHWRYTASEPGGSISRTTFGDQGRELEISFYIGLLTCAAPGYRSLYGM